MTAHAPLPVVIVTGLSGAGKSTALKVFEDLRFFCVDGLPASMVPKLAGLFLTQDRGGYRGLALGMDLRQLDFLDDWNRAAGELAGLGVQPRVLFLDCKPQELLRRYATTRRPHPLESANLNLEQALDQERRLLEPMRMAAELVLDTSGYSIHDLRRILQEKWATIRDQAQGLRVHVVSFGFKYGVPAEADMMFDLRFLPNPYFDPELRPLSGKDPAIAEYVLGGEPGATFIGKFLDFMHYVLPLFASEGRFRLTVGIGCTGGRHRSVAVSERLYASLREKGYPATLEHRHFALG